MQMKRVVVAGAGGFIGGHLVKRLKADGCWVRGVDLKHNEFSRTEADEFLVANLCDRPAAESAVDGVEDVYQLAADMGGAGYIFTGEHDASVMYNSATINLNMLEAGRLAGVQAFLLFIVRVHLPGTESDGSREPELRGGLGVSGGARQRVRVGRSSSARGSTSRTSEIMGCRCVLRGSTTFSALKAPGRAGARRRPPRMCRKVAEAPDRGEIEMWGDGEQTRSFLYVDECIEGVRRLMESDFTGPVNIGSEEMVTLNQLAETTMAIAGKTLTIRHVPGPLGVRGPAVGQPS